MPKAEAIARARRAEALQEDHQVLPRSVGRRYTAGTIRSDYRAGDLVADGSSMESMKSLGHRRVRFSEAINDGPIGMALVQIDSWTGRLGPFLAVDRALCALGDDVKKAGVRPHHHPRTAIALGGRPCPTS
jgi:hypothetical protein